MANGLFATTASSSADPVTFAKTLYKTPALVRHGVRCGHGRCRCRDGVLHGPYTFLYWRDDRGRQRRRYVRQRDVAAVEQIVTARRTEDRARRQQLAEALADLRRLRHWLRELARREGA